MVLEYRGKNINKNNFSPLSRIPEEAEKHPIEEKTDYCTNVG